MPRYDVSIRRTVETTETVTAPNPWQAAIVAAPGIGAEVLNVLPARPGRKRGTAPPAKKATRKPMSAESRAKLAQNLVKARAARSAKARARKRASGARKRAKKAVKRAR